MPRTPEVIDVTIKGTMIIFSSLKKRSPKIDATGTMDSFRNTPDNAPRMIPINIQAVRGILRIKLMVLCIACSNWFRLPET